MEPRARVSPTGPFPLPTHSDHGARDDVVRRRPARYCYLFDVDEELASGLDLRMRLVARPSTTARVQEVSGLSPYESWGRERLSLGLKAHRIIVADSRRAARVKAA